VGCTSVLQNKLPMVAVVEVTCLGIGGLGFGLLRAWFRVMGLGELGWGVGLIVWALGLWVVGCGVCEKPSQYRVVLTRYSRDEHSQERSTTKSLALGGVRLLGSQKN